MSQFILKNISFSLTKESIGDAIREIEKLKTDLPKAMDELVRRLAEQGESIAKAYIMSFPAIDTGALMESIHGEFVSEGHYGVVATGIMYAAYVEFGTGIVGDMNPHPMQGELGIAYDQNEHGMAGWWYPSDKGWYQPKDGGPLMAWTRGMPARPFMYLTLRELEDIAERNGGRIIAEYIA